MIELVFEAPYRVKNSKHSEKAVDNFLSNSNANIEKNSVLRKVEGNKLVIMLPFNSKSDLPSKAEQGMINAVSNQYPGLVHKETREEQ